MLSWLVLVAVLAWSYGAMLAMIVAWWWNASDDYGHAFFVPVLSVVLLWTRREMIRPAKLAECWENWTPALFGGILGAVAGIAILISVYYEAEVFNPEHLVWHLWYQPVFALVYGAGLGAALFQLIVLFQQSDTDNGSFTGLSTGSFTESFSGIFSVSGCLWGLAFLAVAALMRWTAAFLFLNLLIPLALVPWLFGVTMFVGGWRAMRWAWPAVLFLVFMVPLPGMVSGLSAQTLQLIGTKTSVFAIQTLGIPAVAQGNVIHLETKPLNVAEACSGLRMLMLFFAVCVGAALVLRCPLWEKVVIVLSAAPIAVFANVVRLTITALLYHMDMGDLADHLFHDGAGFLMMPLAMLLLWGEMSLLRKILLDPVSQVPLPLGGPLGPGVHRSKR